MSDLKQDIIINADNKTGPGFNKVKAGLGDIEDSITNVGLLGLSYLSFGYLADGAVALSGVADGARNMSARLAISTRHFIEHGAAQRDVTRIAQRLEIPLKSTATLYTRLAIATKGLTKDHNDVATVVRAFSESLIIGGSNTTEAASATVQFSQALNKGRLNGDEFRTMTEASPIFLDLLSDALGRSKAQLYQMSEAGELTTELLFDVFLQKAPELTKAMEDIPETIGRAAVYLENEFIQIVAGFDEATAASEATAAGIKLFADNLVDVAESAGVVGLALATHYGSRGIRAVRNYQREQVELRLGIQRASAAERARLLQLKGAAATQLNMAQAVARQTTGMARLGVVQRQVIPAQQALTVATANYAGAANAAAAASTRLAAAGAVLSRGVAFLGGPAGVFAVIAATVLAFAHDASEASESTDELSESVIDLVSAYDNQARAARGAADAKLASVQATALEIDAEISLIQSKGIRSAVDQRSLTLLRLRKLALDENIATYKLESQQAAKTGKELLQQLIDRKQALLDVKRAQIDAADSADGRNIAVLTQQYEAVQRQLAALNVEMTEYISKTEAVSESIIPFQGSGWDKLLNGEFADAVHEHRDALNGYLDKLQEEGRISRLVGVERAKHKAVQDAIKAGILERTAATGYEAKEIELRAAIEYRANEQQKDSIKIDKDRANQRVKAVENYKKEIIALDEKLSFQANVIKYGKEEADVLKTLDGLKRDGAKVDELAFRQKITLVNAQAEQIKNAEKAANYTKKQTDAQRAQTRVLDAKIRGGQRAADIEARLIEAEKNHVETTREQIAADYDAARAQEARANASVKLKEILDETTAAHEDRVAVYEAELRGGERAAYLKREEIKLRRENKGVTEDEIAAVLEAKAALYDTEKATQAVLDKKREFKGYFDSFKSSTDDAYKNFVKQSLFGTREAVKNIKRSHKEELSALDDKHAKREISEKEFLEQKEKLNAEFNEKIREAESSAWDGFKDSLLTSFQDLLVELAVEWTKSKFLELIKNGEDYKVNVNANGESGGDSSGGVLGSIIGAAANYAGNKSGGGNSAPSGDGSGATPGIGSYAGTAFSAYNTVQSAKSIKNEDGSTNYGAAASTAYNGYKTYKQGKAIYDGYKAAKTAKTAYQGYQTAAAAKASTAGASGVSGAGTAGGGASAGLAGAGAFAVFAIAVRAFQANAKKKAIAGSLGRIQRNEKEGGFDLGEYGQYLGRDTVDKRHAYAQTNGSSALGGVLRQINRRVGGGGERGSGGNVIKQHLQYRGADGSLITDLTGDIERSEKALRAFTPAVDEYIKTTTNSVAAGRDRVSRSEEANTLANKNWLDSLDLVESKGDQVAKAISVSLTGTAAKSGEAAKVIEDGIVTSFEAASLGVSNWSGGTVAEFDRVHGAGKLTADAFADGIVSAAEAATLGVNGWAGGSRAAFNRFVDDSGQASTSIIGVANSTKVATNELQSFGRGEGNIRHISSAASYAANQARDVGNGFDEARNSVRRLDGAVANIDINQRVNTSGGKVAEGVVVNAQVDIASQIRQRRNQRADGGYVDHDFYELGERGRELVLDAPTTAFVARHGLFPRLGGGSRAETSSVVSALTELGDNLRDEFRALQDITQDGNRQIVNAYRTGYEDAIREQRRVERRRRRSAA